MNKEEIKKQAFELVGKIDKLFGTLEINIEDGWVKIMKR